MGEWVPMIYWHRTVPQMRLSMGRILAWPLQGGQTVTTRRYEQQAFGG